MNNNSQIKCFVVENRMRPEKLLPQESDGTPSSNSSCSSGNNIKGGGNGSEMVISIPLDSVVMPNHQIRHHQQNDEVINSQNNFLATTNQVTSVTSTTIPSPKYVFIRQTSDGSFTTSGSSYITGNNGETAGVGDIILVESMEVSNTEPSFVVNANCTDEDLTSLTWLHDKDLLKSIVQCTSDKSAYTSPIQVTNDGGGGEGDGGGGGGGGHDCGNSDRISPSDFLDESFISEDNSDQHSPKIVEISSANTNNRVVITTDSSNGIENGNNKNNNNNNNDNNNFNQAKPTITNDVTYISVNSNNKIKNVGYSEQDNKIIKNGISNNSSSSNSNIIKINDNNNNNINNNNDDDESIDCSNIHENDNRSSIINKRNVIVDKKSNIIPNTIRISSLTYSTKSGNERILGAIGVNNNSNNNNNQRSENQSNAVIAVEHQYGGEQFVYDTNVDNNNIALMNYEKNDTIPIVANNQEVSVISETCKIISSVPSQQQQQQQQRNIKTLQKLSTNNDNDNNTSVQSNTIQTTTATATTATISSTSLPSPLPPPPSAASSTSSSSSPSSTSSTSSSPSQALSAFQHFHKKYLREMKSGEQKGCALNGTSRSHLNNNQNNNNNNDNNENSNNSTCFYYSDNYSNDSYNNANNTCNNNNNNNNNPITNNDNNNNVNYVYVNNTNNNNNNNNNNNSVNNQADSNNIQNVYVNNDNNNNVSCRNRNNNNNETTNGSISSLSYAQQRFYTEQSAPPPSNNQASSNNRLSVTKDNSQLFETMPTTSPSKNSPIIGYNSNSSTISNHPTPRPAGCPRQKHPNNLPYDPMVHTTNKPPYSFSLLIFMAIEDSPDKALPVKEIYSWIVQHFPYFKNAPNGWKNSVRHNLSLNKSFQKVEKAPNMGKGSLWRVEEQQRPNLLQALTRSPFFPNSSVDKTSYKSTQLSRQDDNNSNHLHITPQKSNLDARLFPKLSKMINEIVTKGTYPESIDPDIEQDVGVEQSTILCRTNSNYNNKSDINDMNNIIGDIYHHHHNNNNKSNINLNNDIISNNEHNQIDKINNYSNSNDNIYKCSYNDNIIINSNRNNNCNGDYCSSPNSAIDKHNITPYNNIQQRLARDCGADTMDDVNAATAMLALKHGPKIFTERFQNGSPVITSSPSEDHTYSAGGGNTSTGSHSQNGSDINSNGASSDAAYESSEESHVYAISAEELEERRRHAEGVDALLSFAMSTSSSQSSSSTNKRYAPSDDDYNDQMTTIIKMNNGTTTTTTTTIDYYQHSSNSTSPSPSPAKKLKSSHNLRTKLKRKVQWVR